MSTNDDQQTNGATNVQPPAIIGQAGTGSDAGATQAAGSDAGTASAGTGAGDVGATGAASAGQPAGDAGYGGDAGSGTVSGSDNGSGSVADGTAASSGANDDQHPSAESDTGSDAQQSSGAGDADDVIAWATAKGLNFTFLGEPNEPPIGISVDDLRALGDDAQAQVFINSGALTAAPTDSGSTDANQPLGGDTAATGSGSAGEGDDGANAGTEVGGQISGDGQDSGAGALPQGDVNADTQAAAGADGSAGTGLAPSDSAAGANTTQQDVQAASDASNAAAQGDPAANAGDAPAANSGADAQGGVNDQSNSAAPASNAAGADAATASGNPSGVDVGAATAGVQGAADAAGAGAAVAGTADASAGASVATNGSDASGNRPAVVIPPGPGDAGRQLTDTSVNQIVWDLIKEASATGKAVVESIYQYIANMKPNMPVSNEDGGRHQAGLYRALHTLFNRVEGDFSLVFPAVLKLFEHHQNGVFAMTHRFRFMDHAHTLGGKDREAFMQLVHLLVTTANPVDRATSLKQIDLTKALEHGVSEAGRNRVRQFYRV